MASGYRARLAHLQQFRRQMEPPLYPSVSYLKFEDGIYKLSCGLWDWKNGSKMQTIDSEHDSAEAARQAYDDFLTQYPPSMKHEPVFLDIVLLTAE